MKVYLNYIPLDYNFAVQIAQYLEEQRDLLSIDNPESAENWEEIVDRISGSDVLIYFISPEAILDQFWQDQLNEALRREIPVIGLLIRETDSVIPSVGERQPIDMTRGSYNVHLRELDDLLNLYLHRGIFRALNRGLIAIIGLIAIALLAAFFLLFQTGDEISPLDQTLTSAAQRPTRTSTQTPTSTSTLTLTYTASPTQTNTSTSTPTSSPTPTPTISPTSTQTLTSTSTLTQTWTERPSATPVREVTSTVRLTFTPTRSSTPTRTNTPMPSHTASNTASATDTSTSTFTPTNTKTRTRTPTIDPNSVVCPGAPVSQLLVGEQAMVIHIAGVSLREEPDTTSLLLEYLILGTELHVADGPVCEQGFRWWVVETVDGLEGWVAEGDSVNYYVVPLEVD